VARRHKIATDAEYARVLALMQQVKAYLLERGFTTVLLASSGNGVHLLCRVDMPNTPEAKRLIRATQWHIADKFKADGVDLQCFCYADRLVRCYGSLNRKGIESIGRTRRRSGIIYE
jgi:hypothetical protein